MFNINEILNIKIAVFFILKYIKTLGNIIKYDIIINIAYMSALFNTNIPTIALNP